MIGLHSIGHRIAIAFGLVLAITAATSSFIVYQSVAVRGGVERNAENILLRGALTRYQATVDAAHRAIMVLINSSDITHFEDYEAAMTAVRREAAGLKQLADATQGELGRELSAAILAVGEAMSEWETTIAAKQIADLDDPMTVDVARLREVSAENDAIWRRIGESFSGALGTMSARLSESSESQSQELSILVVASAASGAVLVLLSVGLAVYFARTIARPLLSLAAATERLKDRDWSVRIDAAGRKDEIGTMSRALEVFRENGRRNDALEADRRREAEAKLAEAEAVAAAVKGFRASASGLLTDLDGARRSLGNAATSLEDVAGTSHSYTSSVAEAAQETGVSVESVASAVEEMSASIREISVQMQNVSRLTREATDASGAAGEKVAGLKKMSENITSVIGLINGIAGQINLLALNATIEAARAGEAGKGFAVVASQVKQLADQTAKATEEISRVIGSVQGEVTDVVGAIGLIGKAIAEVTANCATVASAVEEQSAALDEISHNVTAVSIQTSNVATNVRGVEEKVFETRRVAGSVSDLSAALKSSSEGLSATIERFIAAVANDTGRSGRVA